MPTTTTTTRNNDMENNHTFCFEIGCSNFFREWICYKFDYMIILRKAKPEGKWNKARKSRPRKIEAEKKRKCGTATKLLWLFSFNNRIFRVKMDEKRWYFLLSPIIKKLKRSKNMVNNLLLPILYYVYVFRYAIFGWRPSVDLNKFPIHRPGTQRGKGYKINIFFHSMESVELIGILYTPENGPIFVFFLFFLRFLYRKRLGLF